MKKWLCLTLCVLLPMLPTFAGAETQFEPVCALLTQAVAQQDQVYTLYGSFLDTLDAVAAGTTTVAEATTELTAVADDLRAVQTQEFTLAPSQETEDYMEEAGYLTEDFQALADGASTTAGNYADIVERCLGIWEADPSQTGIDAALLRSGMETSQEIDFLAANTVLIPADDEEAAEVETLVVEPTGYLKATGMDWEQDLDVCMENYDELEDQYVDIESRIEEEFEALENAAAGVTDDDEG